MNALIKVCNVLKKNAPTILTIVGVVGVGTGVVMACDASRKLDYILDESNIRINNLKNKSEESKEVIEKQVNEIKKEKAKDLIKLYLPSGVVIISSLGCILCSHTILAKRYAALGAAYTTLDACFKEYRNSVVDKYGEEADKEIKYGLKTKKNKNGEVTYESNDELVKKCNESSSYARIFDESNPYWDETPGYNQMFIKQVLQNAQDKLHRVGIVYLNEVYKALGFKETKAGQVMGWSLNPDDNSDDFIDFGIYDISNLAKRDFVNGKEKSILLDFNVVDVWSNL